MIFFYLKNIKKNIKNGRIEIIINIEKTLDYIYNLNMFMWSQTIQRCEAILGNMTVGVEQKCVAGFTGV